ncbi:hypothetical protein B0H16DRAFT_1709419 [Mycena metata]|uniref:Uncharacterized protein n=1 Tax=Mycena metata TaxID=1033252 RepID=A0AAD7KHD1_9AGAR|nr:hypothetical protein B0H16DRAFT_1709419 [Mycena metata]
MSTTLPPTAPSTPDVAAAAATSTPDVAAAAATSTPDVAAAAATSTLDLDVAAAAAPSTPDVAADELSSHFKDFMEVVEKQLGDLEAAPQKAVPFPKAEDVTQLFLSHEILRRKVSCLKHWDVPNSFGRVFRSKNNQIQALKTLHAELSARHDELEARYTELEARYRSAQLQLVPVLGLIPADLDEARNAT